MKFERNESIFCFYSFINHGKFPNVITQIFHDEIFGQIATRDIKKGEEILLDY